MATFPVTKRLAIDALPPAWAVQKIFGEFLASDINEGIWLPGAEAPAIVPGRLYYCHSDSGYVQLEDVSAEALKAAKGDIYNDSGELVIACRIRSKVVDQPTLPTVGLRMVRAYVDYTLQSLSRRWSRHTDTRSLKEVFKPFIRPAYIENDELIDAIMDQLRDTAMMIVEFVGEDKWVMHFSRWLKTDIIIEKSIDFRVYDWERRIKSGEWV